MFYVFDVDPDGNLRLAGCEPESPELLIADLLPREVLEIERVADKTAVDADPADKALLLCLRDRPQGQRHRLFVEPGRSPSVEYGQGS